MYEEEGRFKAKSRYEREGRDRARAKYHAHLVDVTARDRRLSVVTKSSYYKPDETESLDMWGAAARFMDSLEGNWSLTQAETYPPCYAAIHDEGNLKTIHDFHEFFRTPVWLTCVRCFKAWYSVDRDFNFPKASEKESMWFSVQSSEILRKWCFDAGALQGDYEELLQMNPGIVECSCGASGLRAGYAQCCLMCQSSNFLRRVGICHECSVEPAARKCIRRRDYVVDPLYCWQSHDSVVLYETYQEHDSVTLPMPAGAVRILGRSLDSFAPEIAALNDLEEMVLSLIHPLVQVYSIPRTGELAYVGHICNFRQDVKQFMKSLPVRPADIPFVLIKPRTHGKQEYCK